MLIRPFSELMIALRFSPVILALTPGVATFGLIMQEEIDGIRRLRLFPFLGIGVPLVPLARDQTENEQREENRELLHVGSWIGEPRAKGNLSFARQIK